MPPRKLDTPIAPTPPVSPEPLPTPIQQPTAQPAAAPTKVDTTTRLDTPIAKPAPKTPLATPLATGKPKTKYPLSSPFIDPSKKEPRVDADRSHEITSPTSAAGFAGAVADEARDFGVGVKQAWNATAGDVPSAVADVGRGLANVAGKASRKVGAALTNVFATPKGDAAQPKDAGFVDAPEATHAKQLTQTLGDQAIPKVQEALAAIPDGAPGADEARRHLTAVLEHMTPEGPGLHDARRHLEAGGNVTATTPGGERKPIQQIRPDGSVVDRNHKIIALPPGVGFDLHPHSKQIGREASLGIDEAQSELAKGSPIVAVAPDGTQHPVTAIDKLGNGTTADGKFLNLTGRGRKKYTLQVGKPEAPVAIAAGSTFLNVRRAIVDNSGDAAKATAQIADQIKSHLDSGGAAIIHDRSESTPVTVVGGALVGPDGKPAKLTPSARVEMKAGGGAVAESAHALAPQVGETPADMPAVESPNAESAEAAPPDQPALLAKVQRDAHERDMNDPMQGGYGVNLKNREIPDDVASQFDSHGTATLGTLTKLLNGGVQSDQEFYSSPLNGAGEDGGYGLAVRDSSPFVVLGHPGQSIKDGGIAAVAVDDLHAPSIPELQKAFPSVKFMPAAELRTILPTFAKDRATKLKTGEDRLSRDAAYGAVSAIVDRIRGGDTTPEARAELGEQLKHMRVGQLKEFANTHDLQCPKVLKADIVEKLHEQILPHDVAHADDIVFSRDMGDNGSDAPTKPAPPVPLSPHHEAVKAKLLKDLTEARLSPEVHAAHEKAIHAWGERTSSEAARLANEGLTKTKWHADTKTLGEEVAKTSPNIAKAVAARKVVAGTFNRRTGEANLDGATANQADWEVAVHEINGHGVLRAKPELLEESRSLWKKEIKDNQNHPYKYARENAEEGFAEAMRIAAKIGAAKFKQVFPEYGAFLEKRGLLHDVKSPAPAVEIFDKPIYDGEQMADTLLKIPAQETPKDSQAATIPLPGTRKEAETLSATPVSDHPLHAPITKSRPLNTGVSETHIATLANGKRGVVKPAEGQPEMRPGTIPHNTYHRREAATSSVAKAVGYGDMVPETVVRDVGGKPASIQEFVPHTTEARELTNPFDGPEDRKRAAKLHYLIGASDVHPGNALLDDKPGLWEGIKKWSAPWTDVDREGGKLHLIDNGLSLPTREDPRHLGNSDFLRASRKDVVDAGDLAGKWPKIEEGLRRDRIEPEAIEGVKARHDALLAATRDKKTFGELPYAGGTVKEHMAVHGPTVRPERWRKAMQSLEPQADPNAATIKIPETPRADDDVMPMLGGVFSKVRSLFSKPAIEQDGGKFVKPVGEKVQALKSYTHHIGVLGGQLASMGVHDIWKTDLRTSPHLRQDAIRSPGLFDKKLEHIESSLKNASQFMDEPTTLKAIQRKMEEVKGLRDDIDAFRAKNEAISDDLRVMPEHFGKKGAAKANMEAAVKHLEGGGSQESAVEHLMKNMALEKSTAKKYVRAAIKAASAEVERQTLHGDFGRASSGKEAS